MIIEEGTVEEGKFGICDVTVVEEDIFGKEEGNVFGDTVCGIRNELLIEEGSKLIK